jgi:large subunit ribosomal protein L4
MAETKKKTTTKKDVKVEKKEVKVKRNPKVWDVPFNADLVAQVLYVYSSNERKSTANVKDRSKVSGGGKKPWRQKGTGRARVGSSRSPIWVGGGVAFGNVGDRNWNRKINKKMARKATCVLLSESLRKKILEFTDIAKEDVEKVKKDMKNQKSLTALVITNNVEFAKKVRNVEGVEIVSPLKVNAKHIARNRFTYVDNEIVDELEKRLTNEK